MKRNVDLTENAVFHQRRMLVTIFGDRIPFRKITRGKSKNFSKINEERQPFKTGNKETRYYKKICDYEQSNNICDCCGKSMHGDWRNNHMTLCHECYEMVHKDLHKRNPFAKEEKEEGRVIYPWRGFL